MDGGLNKMEESNRGQRELEEQVLKQDLCTGCGACVGICPYQAAYQDKTVILFPCDIKNGRCYAFCPRTPGDANVLREKLFSEADLTPEIGAVKAFYIVRAKDESLRAEAQHGGTVTALMTLALAEGLIDTAVVAEAAENFLPRGVAVTESAAVRRQAKSKFVVSPTLAEFNRVAAGPSAAIGVVATPCQALALAKMRLKPIPENDNHIDKLKLVVGLFCGWALSWSKLSALLKAKVDRSAVKGMDIPPSKYHTLELYTAGETISVPLDEVTPCVRTGCHYCADMTAEYADISVGSARLAEGWEVARGWNQVIVRTDAGRRLMDLAAERGILEFLDVPEENLEKLKRASMGKKRTAIQNLTAKSGSKGDLLYLNPRDPALARLAE
jgi:coenzyme F420 hydrogenase subunit beta